MSGETVTWWGVLGAIGAGIVIAMLIALAINAWNRRR
jgi:hypothetical protein